jgi:hypothetical protein
VAGNAQKTPIAKGLERWSKARAEDAYRELGKALPASIASITGSIVEVKFEIAQGKPWTLANITVPIVCAQYARPPFQVGELGGVMPFDIAIGNISGLGPPSAPLPTMPVANLGGLVWVPVSSVAWSDPDDPNAYCIYGPNGFRARDTANNCSFVLDTENITETAKTTWKAQVGGISIVVDASGITLMGDATIDGGLNVTGTTEAGNGATGTFTTVDGKTVTVTAGIVTSIV